MNSYDKHLIGVDLGLSSIKITILNCDGSILDTKSKAINTYYPHTGQVEQNPLEWKQELLNLLSPLKDTPPRAIAISAGTHTLVLLDKKLQPLRPAILWSDQRSFKQVNWLKSKYKDYIEKTSLNTPSSTWTLAMLCWLQENEPEVIKRTHYLLPAKDYLRFLLTGEIITDAGDATGTMLYDANNKKWDTKLVSISGLTERQLPIISSSTSYTRCNNKIIKDIDNLIGVPVITSSIDTTTELLACGATSYGDKSIKLASAGVYSWVDKEKKCLAPISCYPHINSGTYYFAGGNNSCMSSLKWFMNNFLSGYSIEECEFLIGQSKATSLPIFHPYLLGERAPLWDSSLKASFTGISITHNLADIAKAVYLGICYSIRHIIESAPSTIAKEDSAISLIGGGSKSDLLCTMLTNVLQSRLTTFINSDASMGSAMLAGIGTGIWNNTEEAIKQCIREKNHYKHNDQEAEIYQLGYENYISHIYK